MMVLLRRKNRFKSPYRGLYWRKKITAFMIHPYTEFAMVLFIIGFTLFLAMGIAINHPTGTYY